jgi:peptide/nickel transport system substrate-binding protein
MKKALVAIAAIAAAGLALTGCVPSSGTSTSSSGSGSTASAGALNIGNFADVTNWDPSKADIGFDGPYLSAVYDPLLGVNGKGDPEPALATSWSVSSDGKTVTLHLRNGVKFSDGETFDAQAAVTSLDYLKAGATSGATYATVSKFVAVNSDTVQIDLTSRDNTLLYLMAIGRSYMMAPKAITAGTLSKDPVGSGPYTLASTSVAGSVYHFTKVKDYWDAKQFPWSSLSISPIQDDTARDNAMMSNQINVNYADPTALQQAKQQGWNVAGGPATWVGLQFTDRAGEQSAPLGNVKVRQALNYAFDGAAILKSVGSGEGVATNQVFPVGTSAHLSSLDGTYKTDLSKAKSLMASAGYANGFAMHLPMTTVFQAWQPVATQVFNELGITVTWDNMQYPDYQQKAPTYPMFIAVIAMDSNPFATIANQISQPQWYNPTPELDKFPSIQAQVNTVMDSNPADAGSAIDKLNTMITQQAWFDIWYQSDNDYVSTKNIKVTPVTGMMFPSLRQIQPAK